jgi:hypothetical protein
VRKQIALPAIITLTVVSVFAQKTNLKGTVVDPMGAVIGKAYVLLHTDALERENPVAYRLELRTNKDGEFVASLPSGFYDLFTGEEGFAPYCQKLRVHRGRLQELRIVLKVDKLMLKEYGDKFPVQ